MKTVRTLQSDSSHIVVNVTVSGSKILIDQTDITYLGSKYTLPQTEAELVSSEYRSGIIAYIARDTRTNDIFILVDHLIKSGKDKPIKLKDHGLEALHVLFTVSSIPPNTTSFEELDVKVFNVVQQ